MRRYITCMATETTTYRTTRHYVISCRCGARSHGLEVFDVTRTTSWYLGQRKTHYHESLVSPATPLDCACGRRHKITTIKGTKNETPCGAKCLHSKGHVCECSCGGANHGAGLILAPVPVPAAARK